MMKTVDVWQIDINRYYFMDEDMQIWNTQDDFYEYHFEECHCIKDDYENWCEQLEEEHNLQEYKGSEIIKKLFEDLQESRDYYKNKFYGEKNDR